MKLVKIAKLLDAFLLLEPTHLPVHFCRVFTEVCKADEDNEPCTYRRLETATGLSNSAVSRTMNALTAENRKGAAGFNLVEQFRDPDEGRRYIVRLTAKGRAVQRQLAAI